MTPPHWLTDRRLGLLLFAAAFLALALTDGQVGFVRDESVYFAAAESYAGWFKLLFQAPSLALADPAIIRSFDFNHEHPVLMKVLYGLSHLVFHEWLGWFRSATAFRLPAFATAALIPLLTFRMAVPFYGRWAALFAAVTFLLVPRQFFNSQLAAFDVPVAAMWLWVIYSFWRAQAGGRHWWLCGIAFGLALATKHNALFLPFVVAPFALWKAYAATGAGTDLAAEDTRLARMRVNGFVAVVLGAGVLYGLLAALLGPRFTERFLLLSPHTVIYLATLGGTAACLFPLRRTSSAAFFALAPLWAIAALGPVVFYLHWPYLWHHPVERTAWWLAFHAQHNHYAWFYLGELLREPPFPLAYVVVKTALTVPAGIFIPMALGFLWLGGRSVAALFPGRTPWTPPSMGELLILLNALVPILVISHPNVPHFGGVKHWFPAMPFLSILAGAVVWRAATDGAALLEQRARPLALFAGLSLLLGSSALISLVRIHPYGTSFYGELAGGLPGAASLGMQRQFWSNNVTGVLPWLNQHAPRGARIYLHEVNGYSFRDYQRNGMLRPDLRPAGGPGDAELAAYQYHQEFREHEMNIWQAFGTAKPVFGLFVDETPQVVVYRRR
ncbi:MAG: glycosyltransferase family 39 protein [Myxococcota bacterium]|nr:glycosyltransferase family 39 protein [Myxococcota bacterium]